MAKAAEDAVWWARFQTLLGTLGFAAVIVSLIFTGWAAVAASRAAGAASASANIAERTLDVMQQTAVRQLRAYISTENGAMVIGAHRPDTITGMVRIKNYGPTPAYHFACWTIIAVGPPDANPFAQVAAGIRSDSILGPGAVVDQTVLIEAPPHEIAGLRDQTRKLFIWGRADYVDAFGEKRFFIFRCSVNGPTARIDLGPLHGAGWPLQPDPAGYDAD